jgi:predicted alpha/beta superfamily hydrolase
MALVTQRRSAASQKNWNLKKPASQVKNSKKQENKQQQAWKKEHKATLCLEENPRLRQNRILHITCGVFCAED